MSQPSFVSPLREASAAKHRLVNDRTGRMVAEQLLAAFDSESRRTGLLGRDGLQEDTAMIIAPTSAIHTFFMRFAIDVAFVARNGRVIKIVRALRPWRIAAAWRSFAVVELAAGALNRSDTRVGDHLRVTK